MGLSDGPPRAKATDLSDSVVEQRQEIATIECLLENAQSLASELESKACPSGSQNRRDIIEILRAPSENLHRHDVLRTCNGNVDTTNQTSLSALEEEFFDTGAREHYVHRNTARRVNYGQHARLLDELVVVGARSEARRAKRVDQRTNRHLIESHGNVDVDGQAGRTMDCSRLGAKDIPAHSEASEDAPEVE